MKKDLNHIVRSAFEDDSTDSAPNMAWSAIDKELSQSSIDSVIKESFESQGDTAPELVWERVQDQLDIDRVWTRIANSINIKRHLRYLQYASVILILLLPFNLDFDLLKLHPTLEVSADMEINTVSNQAPVISQVNDYRTNEENTPVNFIATVSNNSSSSINDNSHSHDTPAEITPVSNSFNEPLATLPLEELGQNAILEIQPLFIPKQKRSIGLLLGGVSSLENTWILDNETRSGFDDQSLVENKFSLGSSYGVFAEYQVKPFFSVSADYLFQSRSTQSLYFYNKGIYSLKEREINSYKVSLMMGWNSQPKYYGVSHSTLLKLGGYYTGVKSDFTRINGVLTNVNSIYKRHDAGLRFEVGKRIYLDSFVIDGGIKADFGLANLASKKSFIPAHLNFTRLVSGGAYIRIGYVF